MWGQTKRRGNWEVTHLTLAEEAKNRDWSVRCHTSDYLCVDCCWYFDFCVDHLFPNIAIQRNIIVAMCEVQNWGWTCWGASFCWCFGVWARQVATDSSRKQNLMCADDKKCSKAFPTSDQCISSLFQRPTMLGPNMHQIFSDVNTV